MSPRIEKKMLNRSSQATVRSIQKDALITALRAVIRDGDIKAQASVIDRFKRVYKGTRTIPGLRRIGFVATRHHEYIEQAYKAVLKQI